MANRALLTNKALRFGIFYKSERLGNAGEYPIPGALRATGRKGSKV